MDYEKEKVRPLVLYAEDNDPCFGVVANILDHYGFEVQRARNGVQLVDFARQLNQEGKLAAIVTDVKMPEQDGIQAIKELRDSLPLDFPIIFITGHVNSAVRSFADTHNYPLFHKPVLFKDFLKELSVRVQDYLS